VHLSCDSLVLSQIQYRDKEQKYKFKYRTILCDKTIPFIRPGLFVLVYNHFFLKDHGLVGFSRYLTPFPFVIYFHCNSHLPIPILYAVRSSIGIVAGS
jgi:hypothetical protein